MVQKTLLILPIRQRGLCIRRGETEKEDARKGIKSDVEPFGRVIHRSDCVMVELVFAISFGAEDTCPAGPPEGDN